jgi:hypothetical protein
MLEQLELLLHGITFNIKIVRREGERVKKV